MVATGALHTLLNRAQRRYWTVLLLEQATIAAAACLGAFVLLLLVGTQILDWYWLLVVFAAAFGFGVWRTWKRRLTGYQIAQRVDHQFASHDLLSTAYYYSGPDCSRQCAEDVRDWQLLQAEKFAGAADVKAVFPLRIPRAFWSAAALAGIALTLFVTRYGMERSLDLRKPLVTMDLGSFFTPKTPQQVAEQKKNPIQKYLDEQMKALGISAEDPQSRQKGNEPQLTQIQAPDEEGQPGERGEQQGKADRVTKGEQNEEAGEPGENTAAGAQNANDNSSESNDGNPQGQKGQQQKQQQAANQKQPGENSSLMDKMRDAMANLMAKLKTPQQPGGDKSGNSQQQQQNAANQQGQSKQGMPNPGKQSADGNKQGEQQSESQGEAGEKAEAQAKQGDRSSDKPGDEQSKSGVGKSDGDKSAREAEQLAAMGKISELIGKRSQNVSGEITVEVQSSKQQGLKTPYSHRVGTHLETGGESHRDEIPLAYERYVQQYFEAVHKAGAEKAALDKASADKTKAKAAGQ